MASLPVFHSAGTLVRLRRIVRASEPALVLLALPLGLAAGLMTLTQNGIAHFMQSLLYELPAGERLSAQSTVEPLSLLALPMGGLVLAGLGYWLKRRGNVPIDVIEANALHGGVMPLRGSLAVAGQTLISNGSGASVGLEAAYAQMGGGVASAVGQWLRLRRADLRVMVGAGAGAAVGAAFGAPLTGMFYAFEIVLGAYTPAAIAPVAVAALAAAIVVRLSGESAYLITLPTADAITTADYFLFAALGLVCANVGILFMRAVTRVEAFVRQLPIDPLLAPVLGGFLLIPIGLVTPQALSAGHGALHFDLTAQVGLGFLAMVFLLKSSASIISLGCGFRGGLFFASLFLGSLLGQLYAGAINMIPGAGAVSGNDAALVGMAAMAVTVVGGPLTMSFLVLEATHDFELTAVALTASLCASTFARQAFGFSFSTWRMHVRGETIRSARDIGRIKSLTAGKLMRRGVSTIDPNTSIGAFRHRFPLGSTNQVVAVMPDGTYAGLIDTVAAHSPKLDPSATIAGIARLKDCTLSPDQQVAATMRAFDLSEANELVVVDRRGAVLGMVSERYVRRRYSEEIEKSQRDMFGERE